MSRLWFVGSVFFFLSAGCSVPIDEETQEVTDDQQVDDTAPILELSPGMMGESEPRSWMGEAEACTAIVKTYGLHGVDIGCATTIKACPGLFRDTFGVSCMQYEATSIETCVANIEAATTCDEIREVGCSVVPLWGTEPAGCEGEPE